MAVDGLGEAYVIPLSSTFENINARFAASSVHIATTTEMKQFNFETTISHMLPDSGYASRNVSGQPSPQQPIEWIDAMHSEEDDIPRWRRKRLREDSISRWTKYLEVNDGYLISRCEYRLEVKLVLILSSLSISSDLTEDLRLAVIQ